MLRRITLLALLGSALLAPHTLADIREPGSSIPPMMFSGVHPSSAAPGQEVTIKGLQFMPGARVWLGGAEAADVRVETGERIVATVPEHPPGRVSVMIRNPDGRSVSRGWSFTYKAP
jgi:hypothetical protein